MKNLFKIIVCVIMIICITGCDNLDSEEATYQQTPQYQQQDIYAVPPTQNENIVIPQMPERKKSLCRLCHGSGTRECVSCNGKMGREVNKSSVDYGEGPTYYTIFEPCIVCEGTGKNRCRGCNGEGFIS